MGMIWGRANELRIDVAVRADAEAQFNAPPHQSELNKAVLGNAPGYLEFKAHCHIQTAF